MAASTKTSLTELAQGLLDVAAAALAQTDAGTPDLVYMSPARPAFDCCPALMLWIPLLGEETTSPLSPPAATGHRNAFGRINLISFTLVVLRCGPEVQKDGTVKTEDIEASAVEVQQDAWVLWCGINCAIKNGVWKDQCSIVHFDRAASVNEQGGCVGWEMTVRADLNGIPCVPSSP